MSEKPIEITPVAVVRRYQKAPFELGGYKMPYKYPDGQ